MRIKFTSLLVDDQQKALDFYTGVLGFVQKHDVPCGEFRWLTVVSPEQPDGPELSLEPNVDPDCRAYQQAMLAKGIPLAAFAVEDLDAEYARLARLGVSFHTSPTTVSDVKMALVADGCGNLLNLYQPAS